jgi:trans-aconitate methyltransferase
LQVGVGAFSRVLLQDFPSSSMIGIDHSPKAVSIAAVVLPSNRSKVFVADMAALPASLGKFDHILSPGSLCYLRSLRAVRDALSAYMRLLRPSGGFCASMLPVSWDERGSCSTYIPESFWADLPDFCLVSSESMENWPVSGGGRYSICGRKC